MVEHSNSHESEKDIYVLFEFVERFLRHWKSVLLICAFSLIIGTVVVNTRTLVYETAIEVTPASSIISAEEFSSIVAASKTLRMARNNTFLSDGSWSIDSRSGQIKYQANNLSTLRTDASKFIEQISNDIEDGIAKYAQRQNTVIQSLGDKRIAGRTGAELLVKNLTLQNMLENGVSMVNVNRSRPKALQMSEGMVLVTSLIAALLISLLYVVLASQYRQYKSYKLNRTST